MVLKCQRFVALTTLTAPRRISQYFTTLTTISFLLLSIHFQKNAPTDSDTVGISIFAKLYNSQSNQKDLHIFDSNKKHTSQTKNVPFNLVVPKTFKNDF